MQCFVMYTVQYEGELVIPPDDIRESRGGLPMDFPAADVGGRDLGVTE